MFASTAQKKSSAAVIFLETGTYSYSVRQDITLW